eukprot:SAG22_NODE_678_length_7959_cov_8.441985_5_plen_753_part_00
MSDPHGAGAAGMAPIAWMALLGGLTAVTVAAAAAHHQVSGLEPRVIVDVAAGMSLRAAQIQARELRTAGRRTIIELGAGLHSLMDGPIVLTAEDSGTEWHGAPGAVISGGMHLHRADFVPVLADDPVRARLPAAVVGSVVRTDVSSVRSAFGCPGCRMAGGGPMELFVADGAALTAARWPDAADNESGISGPGWATISNASADGFSFKPGSSFKAPLNATGTVGHGYWSLDYLDASIHLTGLTASGVATVRAGQTSAPKDAGKRFFLLNQPEFISQPGEYWLDADRGVLYLLPPASPSTDFVLSVGSKLFDLQGESEDVSFRGLTMIAVRGTAITCDHSAGPGLYDDCKARNVRIEGCTIAGMGSGAIGVTVSPEGGAALGWEIQGCNISSIGSIAIRMGGGNNRTLAQSGHLVANTSVHNFGRLCYGFNPAVEISGVGTRVVNNELSQGNGQALMWSGNDHLIEGNVLHDACLLTFDCGGVYESERKWSDRGTVMQRNYVYNIGRASSVCNAHTSNGRHALYMDALSMGFVVRDNILVEPLATSAAIPGSTSCIVNNGGRDNIITNNLCLGWGASISTSSCGITWYASAMKNYTHQVGVLKSVLADATSGPVYKSAYPELRVMDKYPTFPLLGGCSKRPTCPVAPWNNTITHNAAANMAPYVCTSPFSCNRQLAAGHVLLPSETEFASSHFKLGHNEKYTGSYSSLGFANADPISTHCYRLKSGSKLLESLVVPIDVSRVGPPSWWAAWPC